MLFCFPKKNGLDAILVAELKTFLDKKTQNKTENYAPKNE